MNEESRDAGPAGADLWEKSSSVDTVGSADSRRRETEDWLAAGIALAKAGRNDAAREWLTRVVSVDEENVTAWLWLSGAVESLDDREICLENVLTLQPEHVAARKGLEWIRRQRALAGASAGEERRVGPAGEALEEEEAPERHQGTVGDVGEGEVIEQLDAGWREGPEEEGRWEDLPLVDEEFVVEEVGEAAPESEMILPQDQGEELLCPFCSSLTEYEDQRCLSCRQELWVRVRRREKASVWLVLALVFQGFQIVGALLSPLALVALVGIRFGSRDLFGFVPVYLGLPTDLPAEVVSEALSFLPREYLLVAVLPLLYAVFIFAGLYVRWKAVWFFFLLNAGLALAASVAALALIQETGIVPGIIGVVISLLMILIVFQMENDFFRDRVRILNRVDPGLNGGLDYHRQGQEYVRQKRYGLAALHFQRAAGLQPRMIETHLSLAATRLQLGLLEEAKRALDSARRLDPSHPGVKGLSQELEKAASAWPAR